MKNKAKEKMKMKNRKEINQNQVHCLQLWQFTAEQHNTWKWEEDQENAKVVADFEGKISVEVQRQERSEVVE